MFARTPLVLAAALMLAECATAHKAPPPSADSHLDTARLAAFAASTKYPADAKAIGNPRLAALFAPHSQVISIVNLSDTALRDVNVWVNRTYVCRVDVLPAHAAVDVPRTKFYDSGGLNMDKLDAVALRVEVQDGDRLFLMETASSR
jgi:hypothetical protein